MNTTILGIDIGSVSISAAAINSKNGEIVKTVYEFHHGAIPEKLKSLLNEFNLSGIDGIAATTSTPSILKIDGRYDNRVSTVTAARRFHAKIGAILMAGGEKFGLIRFDRNGNYHTFKGNTSCAAGTGSFLDQQARRLNLKNTEELSRLAFDNRGAIPKIASRCAVFAKTDLVHAQQEGYLLEEICDGLCWGLAKNIADTLFKDGKPADQIVFTGGVSKNRAVIRHLQGLMDMKIVVHEMSHLYGAIGAAFHLIQDRTPSDRMQAGTADDVLSYRSPARKYFYEPLALKLSDYPDFKCDESYEYSAQGSSIFLPVEVDVYENTKPFERCEVCLGLDVGSTSTKAILLRRDGTVLAGYYTRTAGRPVNAVQKIFEAIADFIERKQLDWQIIGTGTTGAGRKFSGKIIKADLVLDEITAHARAARELNPEVDTIIEIGGQDSKFTTLHNGRVTFSAMNTVCAAGTGSFIEEQAQKLGCPLRDYSGRAESRRAPIASDRCTVFMERDINHYLAEGYDVDEVLASVLHSVRENYLIKVAIENSIGSCISFQGATAKNKALVAAFEQRLEKPIHVSKYCHLAGAYGVARVLLDQGVSASGFRGIDLYKKNIPIKSETCEICTNHCKITIAAVDGESVAFGFLCGRDYDTRKYVNNNISGFDLLKTRRKRFALKTGRKCNQKSIIGIPAALHLVEDLPLWEYFFDRLSFKVVASSDYSEAVKAGKRIAGAEFCAPVAALHGHVDYLMDKADHIFLPFYLERKTKEKGARRQYCYYTQFASALAAAGGRKKSPHKLLMPLIQYLYPALHTKRELHKMVNSISERDISFLEVSGAYEKALEYKSSCLLQLKKRYQRETPAEKDFHVVLAGRPYLILSESMNGGIPGIFASLGIKTFFQDMLAYTEDDIRLIRPLCNELPWYYAAEVLKAMEALARSEKAYPVFVTAFKCTPDSFLIDYIKKLMASYKKPYLILQLDEHASAVGNETRIEAAIRSFRNHYLAQASAQAARPRRHVPALIPSKEKQVFNKTLVLPNWDKISVSFIAANLRRHGIDARVLEETETSIQKSLRYNTGQCLPLNVIAQEFIDYIEMHNLDPAKTLLWMGYSELACNLKLFPHHIQHLLNSYGRGMSGAGVYAGALSFVDISVKLPLNTYFAYMFGGLIRKIGCRIRPYEREKGNTDKILNKAVGILADAFLGNRSKEDALAEVVAHFEGIATSGGRRPKVAIFGDLYVRDNEVMNQNLISFIEANGGEAVTTPYTDYIKMVAGQYLRKWFIEGDYLSVLSSKAMMALLTRKEEIYYRYFQKILNEPVAVYDESPAKILSAYNLRVENTGESMDNILKIHYIKKHHPDIALFVQTSPAFCCPSLVTEAMASQIEEHTQTPMVSITYDGTGGNKNESIIPYLAC